MRPVLLEYLTTFLFLKVLCQKPPEPEFVGPIPKLRIKAGKDASLKCVIENLGEHKVTWKNVATQALLSIDSQVIGNNERILISHLNEQTWTLHIRNVVPEDTGYYSCQINTDPVKSQAGYIDVVVPPEFVTNMTSRNVTVAENSNVTLSCKASGNPQPKIVWRREDKQPFTIDGEQVHKKESEELIIIGVHRSHMASYLCIASNDVPPPISRRIYLYVKFPPLIYVQSHTVSALLSTDVVLECYTEAHPPSENYWKKGNTTVAANERFVPELKRTSYKTHMRLTIKQIQKEDYTNYKCVAKNSIIETEGSINLNELILPPLEVKRFTTEEIFTRPPRKTTVTFATETYVVTADVERRENNLPGKQQKYGDHGVKSRVRNSSPQSNTCFLRFTLLLCIRTILTYCSR